MVHVSLVLAKLVVLSLGFAVAGFAFLAWRRTRDPVMLWVSAAFFVLAIGSSAEGLLLELFGLDLLAVHTFESVILLAGLLVLLCVLRPRPRARAPAPAEAPAYAGGGKETAPPEGADP